MKKNILIFILLLMLALLSSCQNADLTQSETESIYTINVTDPAYETNTPDDNADKYENYGFSPDEVYDYERFKRYRDINIPVDIINEMSTPALLQTIMNCPTMPNIYDRDVFWGSPGGFVSIRNYSNGINELLKRKDCVETVIKRYKKERVLNSNDKITGTYEGAFNEFLPLDVLELIMAQEDFINKLDEETRVNLFNIVIDKNEEMLCFWRGIGSLLSLGCFRRIP